MKPLTLSVLDTGRPEDTVPLARRMEAAGYDRYWVTEHHTATQSACPSVMAAAVLASTTRLAVTVGGVLARIHSPYFVAEQLKLLTKLYGDRIQFGVAGTLPDAHIREAIGTPLAETPEAIGERLQRLCDLALAPQGTESPSENSAAPAPSASSGDEASGGQLTVGPIGAEPPSFCVCGTSDGAATFTGKLGFPFAFHEHLSPQERKEDRIAVCRQYFDAGGTHLSVAVTGICAKTNEEAERLSEERTRNRGWEWRRPSFVGTPEESAAQIAEIVKEMSADEVVIQPMSDDFDARLFILESLLEPVRAIANR